MTAVFAHPRAVLRVLRRAGRRRALRVVFFLAGLLTLGFLWGGQAYAVEAPLPVRDSAAGAGPVGPVGPLAPVAPVVPVAPVGSVAPVDRVAPVRVPEPQKPSARVASEAAEPVADVVRRVARPVGELRDRVAERRPAVPDMPAPGLPVPALPGGELPPAGVAEVVASSSGGGTQPPMTPAKSVRQGSGDRDRAAGSGAVNGMAGVAGLGAYASYAYGLSGPQRDDAHRGPGRARCGEVPVQGPAGPCGDGVRQSAGDGSSSRSGDKHAAAFADAARFALVRGATLPATAAPTHDRPNEILEFPG